MRLCLGGASCILLSKSAFAGSENWKWTKCQIWAFIGALRFAVCYSLPGFYLRISPGGRKTFGVIYRHAGRLRRMSFGTFPPLKLADARERAMEELRNAAKGEDPAMQKAQDREADSFEALAEDYLNRYAKPKKKSWKEDERIIDNKLNPVIGNITAKCVTRAQMRDLLDGFAAKAPIEANRTLATARKIYNWAISQDLVENNPCHGISAPGVERQRDRVLSEDEIKKLWKEFDNEELGLGATFKLRLFTAQRGREVFSVEWKELDLENAWWTIPGEKSKNGLAHRVPLSPAALSIFKDLREKQLRSKTRKNSSWVFPARRGRDHLTTAQKAVERIRERTECKDFTAHDLRRTAASMMTGMGIPRLTVSKILNHVEPGVTAVYDRHSYDREKREALEAWSRRLQLLVSDLHSVKESDA
jgi:integrase